MLYYFFTWLSKEFNISGAGLFQYITFRAAMAIVLSLLIATVYGKRIISFLRNYQIGESVRELGLAGEQQKKGTPTMGGIIILLAILIPTLLFANLAKVYVRLMVLSTVWLGIIGFVDDYLKLKAKRIAKEKGIDYKKTDSDGLAGKFKIFGQVVLGIIVGATLYFSPSVTVEREVISQRPATATKDSVVQKGERLVGDTIRVFDGKQHRYVRVKTPITTIPFIKTHEFNYS